MAPYNPRISSSGSCTISGVPSTYTTGTPYVITVTIDGSSEYFDEGACQILYASGGKIVSGGVADMPGSGGEKCRYSNMKTMTVAYGWITYSDVGDVYFSALCGEPRKVEMSSTYKSTAAAIAAPNVLLIEVNALQGDEDLNDYEMPTLKKFINESATFEQAYSAASRPKVISFPLVTGRFCSDSDQASVDTTQGTVDVVSGRCTLENKDQYKNLQYSMKSSSFYTGFAGQWDLLPDTSAVTDSTGYTTLTNAVKATGFDYADGVYEHEPDAGKHNLEWQTEAYVNFISSWETQNSGLTYDDPSYKPFYFHFHPTVPNTFTYNDYLQTGNIRDSQKGTLSADPVSGMPARNDTRARANAYVSSKTADELVGHTWLDDSLEVIFDTLETKGIYDNTIVVLVTGYNDNTGTGSMFNERSKIRQYVRFPRLFLEGSKLHQLVSTVDLYPSLTSLVQAPSNALFTSYGKSWVEYAVVVKGGFMMENALSVDDQLVVEKSHRYVHNTVIENEKARALVLSVYNDTTKTTDIHKYIVPSSTPDSQAGAHPKASDSEQLYDLEIDPTEQTTLIANVEYASVLAEARTELCEYLKEKTVTPSLDSTMTTACMYAPTSSPTITTPPPTSWLPNQDLQEPLVLESKNGELNVTLEVREHRQYGFITYTTRAYFYENQPMIPGPTLRFHPGDVVRLTIKNKLKDGPFPLPQIVVNKLNSPNVTNVHTHGLHIGPDVDNIFVEIKPGNQHTYVYKVKYDHPAGLYWYHSHWHGSVSYQMMGGLIGALEVVPRNPTTELPPEMLLMVNQTLVLHHLKMDWGTNEAQEHFSVEPYSVMATDIGDAIAPNPVYEDATKKDIYLTNNQYKPKVDMQPGEKRIFDIVNAVAGPVLELEMSTTDGGNVRACSMQLLALDGVYLKLPRMVEVIVMVPATRASVIVTCTDAGTYYLQSRKGAVSAFVAEDSQRYTQTMLVLQVSGATKYMLGPTSESFSKILRPSYLADLTNVSPDTHWELSVVSSTYVVGAPSVNWIGMGTDCSLRCGSNCAAEVQIVNPDKCVHEAWHHENGHGPANQYRHRSKVGQVEEMVINNIGNQHPVHVHVNHFQVLRYEPQPTPERAFSQDDFYAFGEAGDWRDTFPSLSGRVYTKYRADTYAGETVVHCHFILHEDRGMMGAFYIDDACPVTTNQLPLYDPGLQQYDQWYEVLLTKAFSWFVQDLEEVTANVPMALPFFGLDKWLRETSGNLKDLSKIFYGNVNADVKKTAQTYVSDNLQMYLSIETNLKSASALLSRGKCGQDLDKDKPTFSTYYKDQDLYLSTILNYVQPLWTKITEATRVKMKAQIDHLAQTGISPHQSADSAYYGKTTSPQQQEFLELLGAYAAMYLTHNKTTDFMAYKDNPAPYFGLHSLSVQEKYTTDDVYGVGNSVLQALTVEQREGLEELHTLAVPTMLKYLTEHQKIAKYIFSTRTTVANTTAEHLAALQANIGALQAADQEIAFMQATEFANVFASACPAQINFMAQIVNKSPKEDTCPESCPSSCVWKRYKYSEKDVETSEGEAVSTTLGSCKNRCQKQSIDCWCDETCAATNDCCSDYRKECVCYDGSTSSCRKESGSCDGACGVQSKDGTCFCDMKCFEKGDCCEDYSTMCQTTCKGKCGLKALTGSGTESNGCYCDSSCEVTMDCCSDMASECPEDELGHGSGTGSCEGLCGKKGSDGTCWCDDGCHVKGDCCKDHDKCDEKDVGQIVGSCAGSCGGKTNTANGNCYCDSECSRNGDCCADRLTQCS